MQGDRHSLDDHRGRIVVLNFWATWCVPCREEMPILVSVRDRYASQGVEVIAASTDEPGKLPEVTRFSHRLKLGFPVWVGATTQDMARFGLPPALPCTVILDRDGGIAFRILGPLERADLEERLEWLLGDQASPAPEPRLDRFGAHHHEHEGGAAEEDHTHAGEEEHTHGAVNVEGASLVPS